MKTQIFALLAASALMFTFACSDDSDTTGTGGSGNTTSTGGNGTGGDATGGMTGDMCVDDTNGQPTAMMDDCQAACEILFCCAEQECAGLNASDKDLFVPGCVETCMDTPATISVVNGEDCETTVGTVSSVSSDFADTCANGIPQGGAGGTGGSAGGAGGAGGN